MRAIRPTRPEPNARTLDKYGRGRLGISLAQADSGRPVVQPNPMYYLNELLRPPQVVPVHSGRRRVGVVQIDRSRNSRGRSLSTTRYTTMSLGAFIGVGNGLGVSEEPGISVGQAGEG